jgi:hypothetical protein
MTDTSKIDSFTKLMFGSDNDKSIFISLTNSDNTNIFSFAEGISIVPVVPWQSASNEFPLSSTPLDLLKAIQIKFSNTFRFGNKAFDEIVKSTMDIFNGSVSFDKSVLKEIKMRKLYARYYYSILKNRNITNLDNSSDTKKTVRIVVELVSWWFIRRFVHIYVVCACLEKLYETSSVSSPSGSSTQTQFMYSSTPTPSNSSTISEEALNKMKADFELKLAKQNSNSAKTADVVNDLQKQYNDALAIIAQKDAEISKQKQDLDNLKDLLLNSTSMIFQMDELVPTSMK